MFVIFCRHKYGSSYGACDIILYTSCIVHRRPMLCKFAILNSLAYTNNEKRSRKVTKKWSRERETESKREIDYSVLISSFAYCGAYSLTLAQTNKRRIITYAVSMLQNMHA